ncbi:MAG TPA: 3-hydroxyacyl-ACP dehydratase FabZ family protein [bacterium]|nr:3-hydroxyacyl-ACP dehydratase FabZ family protein [bacterium]
MKQLKRSPIAVGGDEDVPETVASLIPHRPPFLLIDKILRVDPEGLSISGSRYLDPQDAIFQGHFPNEPIYPGVLLIEMAAQLGLCLANYQRYKSRDRSLPWEPLKGYFTKIHHALFIHPALPDQTLTIRVKIIEEDPLTITLAGQVYHQSDLCSLSIIEAYH